MMNLKPFVIGNGAESMSGTPVRQQSPRTLRYLVFGTVLVLVATILGIVLPSRAFAASAAYVQGRNTMVTSGTTASLAFSKANTAGNLIAVYVVWDNSSSVTVSDTKGNTYTAATVRQTWGGNWSSQIFYASQILGGSNTVKATFSTGITSFGLLYLHEYSGLAGVSPVDGSASAIGTSASMSSGTVTTTQANDLLFAAGASDDTAGHGTGFTARLTGYGNITEDRNVTAIGSYAGTGNQTGITWVMQLVAFRVTSGAPGPATKLAFVQGPSNTGAGAAMTPAVKVAVEDANGNIETSDNTDQVSLALGTNTAGGTLSGGAAVTVASGVATFSGLSINRVGAGYTLTASSPTSPSLSGATSAAFNITPGVSAKLAFVQSPSNTAAGSTMTPAVQVAVEDASGNIETSDNTDQVSLAIGTNPAGGALSGGAAVAVASGVATFPALSINTAGNGYTLTATSTPSYTAAISSAFNITASTAGPPAKLAFVQGPTSTVAGVTITPAVQVAVEDASGNIVTSDNTDQVSLAIGTNPTGGALTGGSAVTVVSGIATFGGLSINTAGSGYTLTPSSPTSPSLSGPPSAAFNITSGASSDWTMYLGGNDRTNYAANAGGFTPTSVQKLGLAWKASDAGPSHGVFSQPMVSNGLVYWGSFDGYERATSTSGQPVWQMFLGTTTPPACSDPSEAGVVSTPTITTDVPVGGASSVLYIGGGNSTVYALNAATGAVLWSHSIGGNPNTFLWSSPAVFGNSVYIGSSSFGDCPLTQGQLIQLNRVTGAVQNIFNVVPNGCNGGGIWSSPTVDAAAGTIYFSTGTGSSNCPSTPGGPSLYEVSASNLSLVGSWTIPVAQQITDADFGATPTLFSGVIGGQSEPLVGMIDKNGVFYALKRDALASGPVWSTRIAIGGGDPTVGQGDIASAAWDGTTLYVGGDNTSTCSGTVNALNPSTGAFIWQHCFTDGGFVMGGVTAASGGVVAVGEGTNIAVLSAATGAPLLTYAGVGPFWGPPTIAGSNLYEGDMAGNLYALTTNQTPGALFVQVNSATPQTNQSAVTVPFLQAQGAGDLNVVAVGLNDATSTITSVTDSAGNVYQLAAPMTRGSGLSQAIYYAKNIKAATAGSNVVTVQFPNAVPYVDLRVAEYSGLDTVSPFDTTASGAGSGATANSGNLTTSAATELIFGAGMTSGGFANGTNGFISRIITAPDADIAGDEYAATPGSYAATATMVASADWVMQAVAFHVAG
jgi:outer membrane protein assembly factor BamB